MISATEELKIEKIDKLNGTVGSLEKEFNKEDKSKVQ